MTASRRDTSFSEMNEIRRFYDRYHPLENTSRPLDLGAPCFMDDLGRLAAALLKGKFLSHEFLFLSRTESGMCNVLHILKAHVTTTQIALEWMPATK